MDQSASVLALAHQFLFDTVEILPRNSPTHVCMMKEVGIAVIALRLCWTFPFFAFRVLTMSEPSAVNQVVLLRLHYSAISQDSSCCLDGIIEARLFDDVNILKWLLSTMRKSTAFRRGTP